MAKEDKAPRVISGNDGKADGETEDSSQKGSAYRTVEHCAQNDGYQGKGNIKGSEFNTAQHKL